MRISDWSSDVCSSDLARLDDARDQPGRAEVAQCDTRHLELAVDTAGTTGQLTAVPDADPRTVPRHLRQGDGRQEPFFDRNRLELGRASCRERVCQYVSISVVADQLKKKKTKNK